MQVGAHFSSGGYADLVSVFQAQMGYFPTLVSDYQDDTSHASLSSGYPASAYLTHMPNSQFILGLPVLFTGNSTPSGLCGGSDGNLATQVAALLAGSWDSGFDYIANYLATHFTAANGYGGAPIVRINWELNGSWYCYGQNYGAVTGCPTAAQSVAIFQHVATILHSYKVLTCWNVACLGASDCPPVDVQTIWPGASYVDFIGIDTYAESSTTHTPGSVVLNQILNQGPGYQGGISGVTSQGINSYYVPMSIATGVPLIFPEIGLIAQTAGTGDDPTFMAGIANVLEQNGATGVLWCATDEAINIFGSSSPLSSAQCVTSYQNQPAIQAAIRSIDTMKASKDTASSGNFLNSTQITQQLTTDLAANATHVAISTPYDQPTYQTTWATAARALGYKIWWRAHSNGWQGDFGASTPITPATLVSDFQSWLNSYGTTLIRAGDVVDPCCELENGTYWASEFGGSWSSSQPAMQQYNQLTMWLRQVLRQWLVANSYTFDQPGGVETRIHSVDSYFATTQAALGLWTYANDTYLAMDFYPDTGTTVPATAWGLVLSQFEAAAAAFPNLTVGVGEHGYNSSGGITNAQQSAVLEAELVTGFLVSYPNLPFYNYWCDVPDVGSPGFTELLTGSAGAWSVKPAMTPVATYFGATNPPAGSSLSHYLGTAAGKRLRL